MNDSTRQELISAYLDGELSAEEQAQVERLLAESSELRQWCDELKRLRAGLQALPRKRLGTGFAAAITQRAQQALASQEPAVATTADKAPAPASATPASPPTPAKPSKSEPEVAPSGWPFANFSPRTVFWPLAALAAGLLLMIFNPAKEEPTPVVVDNTPARPKSDEIAQRGVSTRYGNDPVSDASWKDADGDRKHGEGFGVRMDRPLDRLSDLKDGRSEEEVRLSAKEGAFDTYSLEAKGREPDPGKKGQNEWSLKQLAKELADSGGLQNGALTVIEVVMPAKWQEDGATRALARRNIALEDRRAGRFYSNGRDDLAAGGIAKESKELGAEFDGTRLERADDYDGIQALRDAVAGWKRSGPKEEVYFIAATPESLKALFTDVSAQGGKVALLSLQDGEAREEALDDAVSKKAGDDLERQKLRLMLSRAIAKNEPAPGIDEANEVLNRTSGEFIPIVPPPAPISLGAVPKSGTEQEDEKHAQPAGDAPAFPPVVVSSSKVKEEGKVSEKAGDIAKDVDKSFDDFAEKDQRNDFHRYAEGGRAIRLYERFEPPTHYGYAVNGQAGGKPSPAERPAVGAGGDLPRGGVTAAGSGPAAADQPPRATSSPAEPAATKPNEPKPIPPSESAPLAAIELFPNGAKKEPNLGDFPVPKPTIPANAGRPTASPGTALDPAAPKTAAPLTQPMRPVAPADPASEAPSPKGPDAGDLAVEDLGLQFRAPEAKPGETLKKSKEPVKQMKVIVVFRRAAEPAASPLGAPAISSEREATPETKK